MAHIPNEVHERIKKLREAINRYRYLYHVEDTEEISADALDALKHELVQIEEKYPELVASDSPTQRVSGKPTEEFPNVKHRLPMLSLDNTYSEEEVLAWDKRVDKGLSGEKREYVVEPKIDGVSLSLT